MSNKPGISRRDFLAATGVATMAASLPLGAQQPAPKAAKSGPYVRMSITDPRAPAMLASYATAIKALLQLPPTDPRNFYRNAFIHTLDCPHGNWWFLPWHRGYLGWWEQTVRDLSGNPEFAFPYWDWTVQPFVPDAFWQGVLNPSDPAYISNYNDFYNAFNAPMAAFYAGLTQAQQAELAIRGYSDPAKLWSDVQQSFFFPSNQARSLTQQNPGFDSETQQAVTIQTVDAALATPYFSGGGVNPPGGFGSDIAKQHSGMGGFGILEGQPHNNVHNDVGGFMGDFLSPVDPIFMAHHANIDRLWSVWTAQQQAAGAPPLPTGDEYTQWAQEAFLFYINSAGQPVTLNKAGDYASSDMFNYTYTIGSGAPAAGAAKVAQAPAQPVQRVVGKLSLTKLNFSSGAVASVAVPEALLGTAAEGKRGLRAHITLTPPKQTRNVRFHIFVNPPADAMTLDVKHPSYAGTFEFFGTMHHKHDVTFTVSLREPVRKLRAAGALTAKQPLNLHIVPETRGVALKALAPTTVKKVEVSG